MTKRNMQSLGRECGNKPLCYVVGGTIGLLAGVLTDVPYYAVKGVGLGLYYGGKGLYHGGIGLGKGIGYTGRAIGRGLAYPFNRPPKPVLPPTTWEQYKHDVIKYQKRRTKADKTNKANQRWCVSRVPLSASANRSEWEARCNPGDAVSRAALPPDVLAPEPAVVETVAANASPAVTAPTVDAPGTPTIASPSSNNGAPIPPAPPVAEAAAESLVPAPTAGDPAPSAAAAPSPVPEATPSPDASQQKVVQTGVAPEKAGLNPTGAATNLPPVSAGFSDGNVAIAGTAPAPLSQGKPLRTLPSATPANSLTPSEYGFEGRGGYGVTYNHVWGEATAADKFVEHWSIIGPWKRVQTQVRTLAIDNGTTYAKDTLFERAKAAFLDFLKRVRGSAGIVDRASETQDGRTLVKKYALDVLDDGFNNMNAAVEGKDVSAPEQQEKRLDDLRRDTVKTVMGQAGDPLENLKEAALDDVKQNLPLTMTKKQSIRQATVCHFGDPTGLGCAKSKLIYSPPR